VHHINRAQITYGHTLKYAGTPLSKKFATCTVATPDDGRRAETCRFQCINVLILLSNVILVTDILTHEFLNVIVILNKIVHKVGDIIYIWRHCVKSLIGNGHDGILTPATCTLNVRNVTS
jgi:hypothetical protein